VLQKGEQAMWDFASREGGIDLVDLVHDLSQISICIACQGGMIPGVIHKQCASVEITYDVNAPKA